MIPFVLVSTSHLPFFSTKFAASNFCLDEEFADAYVAWTAQAADHSGTLGSQKLDSISGNWCRFSACISPFLEPRNLAAILTPLMQLVFKRTFARLEKQVEGLPMKFDAICAGLGMLPLKA